MTDGKAAFNEPGASGDNLDCIELYFDKLISGNAIKDMIKNNPGISGICLKLSALNASQSGTFKEIIDTAKESGVKYIAIDTEETDSTMLLDKLVCECKDRIVDYVSNNINRIFIENGYMVSRGKFYHNPYSDVAALKKQLAALNEMCGVNAFEMCLNIGHANLLSVNIKNFIEESKGLIGLVHASDNDTLTDQHQLPFTFTTGRGILTTEWTHYIGSLNRIGFDGYIIFDVKGAFEKFPEELHGVIIKICDAVVKEWNQNCFAVEDNLNQPEKTLVLFGAGRMVSSYLEAWKDKYMPAFIVDNNEELWGKERFGIPVKSPEDILLIPEDKRNVWICNTYYNAIGKQLEKMGIKYRCYYDHYFIYAQ